MNKTNRNSKHLDCTCFGERHHFYPIAELQKWCGHRPPCGHCARGIATHNILDETTVEWLCEPCFHALADPTSSQSVADSPKILPQGESECLTIHGKACALPEVETLDVESQAFTLSTCDECSSFAGLNHVFPVEEMATWCGHQTACAHCHSEPGVIYLQDKSTIEWLGVQCWAAACVDWIPPYRRVDVARRIAESLPHLMRCGPGRMGAALRESDQWTGLVLEAECPEESGRHAV